MAFLRDRNTLVWLALVGATLASFALAESAAAARIAVSAVILIGAFKVRLVFLHFMELKGATGGWRAAFEIWTLAVLALLLGGYWLGAA